MLLWLLSAMMAVLAAYTAQGWLRQGLKRPHPMLAFGPLALAALVWGSVLAAVPVLSLSAASTPYPVGFRTVVMPLLWLGTVMLVAVALYGLLCRRTWWMYLLTGLLLAGATLPAMMLSIWAVGFRPGVVWQREWLGGAAALLSVAGALSAALGFGAAALDGHRRMQWRLCAAALMGLAPIAAQELVSIAAGLKSQVGSVFQYQTPLTVLALLYGAVLPILLAMAVIDLELRRNAQRRRHDGTAQLTLRKRTKRRSNTREA